MSNTLTLFLFGTPQLNYRDQPLVGFTSNKTRALFIYLAVTAKPHSRDALSSLFWAENRATARTNLRKALSNLRQLEGIKLVEPTSETIALDLRNCWVDITDFDEIGSANEPTVDQILHATQLYQADFLSDFPISLSYEFEEWALSKRANLKRRMIELWEQLFEKYEKTNDLPQAIASAKRILVLEPWRERTHQQLMLLLARSGNRGAALAQYKQCVRSLKDELDVDPSIQTNELYESIRSGEYVDDVTTNNIRQTTKTPAKPKPVTNLPIPPTPLVGRQQVLQKIAAQLQREEVRLLTLTGPGGVGKTRLAIQAGRDLAQFYSDGVVFVELASLQSGLLVPVALADAMGIRESMENRPWMEHIVDYLAEKQLLLIIDNFEHVLDGAEALGSLLSKIPKLKMLVTSRELLRLRGEFQFDVLPLDLPSTEDYSDYTKLENVESVQLFIQQARMVRPDFKVEETGFEHIIEICARLDGLPLAIELAAARVKMLRVKSIAERVEQRFALLEHGPRDAPKRHQTLRNAIDWSYEQLTVEEQSLFRTLSTFVGGCTVDAVESLCSKVGDSTKILELMGSLVDKSLVRQSNKNDEYRFTQLETLLQYGQDKACKIGMWDDLQDAHANYFLSLAEDAEPMLFGAEQVIWLQRLSNEHDNLRVTLSYLIQKGDTSAAARLGIALWHYWYISSHHLEGIGWIEKVLALNVTETEKAKLLYGKGMLARRTGNDEAVSDCLIPALEIFRQLEDDNLIASSLRVLGFNDYRARSYDKAEYKLQEALALFKLLGNTEGIAATLINLGYICHATHNYNDAQDFYEESLAIRRETENQHGIANCLSSLGFIAIYQQNFETAKNILHESCTIYESLGNSVAAERALYCLAAVSYSAGDYSEAANYCRQSSSYAKESKNDEAVFENHLLLVLLNLRSGNHQKAVALFDEAFAFFSKTNQQEKVVISLAIFSLIAFATTQTASAIKTAAKVQQIQNDARTNVLFSPVMAELYAAITRAKQFTSQNDFERDWATGETNSLEEIMTVALGSVVSD